MNIIVAVDKNWAIGKDNKLLVAIPADMKMFRQETTGEWRNLNSRVMSTSLRLESVERFGRIRTS